MFRDPRRLLVFFQRLIAVFSFVCVLWIPAAFAQTSLTVRDALLVLSDVRAALSETARQSQAGEVKQAPESRTTEKDKGSGKGAVPVPEAPQPRP